eukprot:TRINITY_DN30728_c0_g1_i1.p1 TRINITY_DN30728_c0_g1~~TRINITY_DN30728_c0_g1_i1.p1  ORF type:complete len:153 (-),score=7.30 TRINITY_DN30728_c0_g1_i1:451-909(-)
MRLAKIQPACETQEQARWRASRLRKRRNDPDDEDHLDISLRKRVTEPVKTWHEADEEVGSNFKASWMSMWSAPRSAIRMPTRRSQSSGKARPADNGPAVSEPMWCVPPTRDRLRGIAEIMSKPPTHAQRTRYFDWTKRKNTRVHVSFDPIIP